MYDDLQEHVDKSELSYADICEHFANTKGEVTMPPGTGDFIIFATRLFIQQPIVIIKPSIKKKGRKKDNEYVFEKVFVNELDKKLDKSEIGIVLVWNGLDYFAPAMEKVICEISDDLIYSQSNLLYTLDKSIELQGKLPPSASKDTLGKAIIHMRAAKEFLCGTLVTTGTTNVAPGMAAIASRVKVMRPRHFRHFTNPAKKRKNANGDPEAAGTGNGDNTEIEESNEYDDPDACYTGRNPGKCCFGVEFNMPDELDNHVKIVHTERHNWSCTGKLISEGKEVPCEQSFTRGDTLWTHYRKVHLKIYHYMCSLKKRRSHGL